METSGSGSLAHGRRVMKQLHDLEVLKEEVKKRDTVETDLQRVKADRATILEQLTSCTGELDKLRSDRDAVRAKLDALQGSKEETKFKQWKEEREHYQKQITECQDQITAVREKFNKQMDAWRAKQQEEREKKQKEWEAKKAAQKREYEERQKARAEKEEQRRIRSQEAERERMMNPHEKEIDCCKNLIAFLEGVKGQQRVRVASTQFDATSAAPKDGLKALKRDNEDDWLFGDRRKKAAAQKAAAPAKEAAPKAKKDAGNRPVPMTGPRMTAFGNVKVAIPKHSGQIDATLAELREKMAKWEATRRSEEEVDAELKAKAEAKAAAEAAAAPAAEEAAEPAAAEE
eukprot:NODE_1846_length_1199_cov_52.917910_g1830_i0.p1 GENE.NODE_1846_length_1199_cov_52.917910_g1830_i0~~NODE_1846_length_1199_cov_52.917910_g1830_i0.p1  ORF type:complete len:376 (+),score=149.82 NODE_1846_length_1199_cov_52.917910_g1830_i0:94-1128(+)